MFQQVMIHRSVSSKSGLKKLQETKTDVENAGNEVRTKFSKQLSFGKIIFLERTNNG